MVATEIRRVSFLRIFFFFGGGGRGKFALLHCRWLMLKFRKFWYWCIWANFHTMGKYFFHQKYPLLSSDLKNVVTKDFSMQPFANFLQIRCYCKFLDNHKKDMSWRYLLESLFNACFNKVTILMACNFIKKETTPQKNVLKVWKKLFMQHLWWLPLRLKCGWCDS